MLVEAVSNLGQYLNRRADFGADVLALLDQGRMISGAEYADAQRLRRMQIAEFSKLWMQVDCIFTPATPTPAPKIGQTTIDIGGSNEDVRLTATRFMRAINVLGDSSAGNAVRIYARLGCPSGCKSWVRRGAEVTLLRVGAGLEDALALTSLVNRQVSGERP